MPIRDWFAGLQFRLIAAFAATLGLALVAVGLFVSSAAESETNRFRLRNQEFRTGRVHGMISSHFQEHRSWEGIQPSLEQAGSFYGRRFVVLDSEGRVVGDSHHRREKGRSARHDRGRAIPVVVEGSKEGTLVLASVGDGAPGGDGETGRGVPPPETGPGAGSPGAAPTGPGPEQASEPLVSRVTAAVNKSLLLAGLVTGAAGVALIFLASRRILAPVNALGIAARRLGQGDLGQRVPARGPSEIRHLGNAFNSMAENLQAAEQQRRNLTADVAHELRTPLSNIQGYLDAVHDGLLEPDQATIGTLRQQTGHLVTLVEDLRLLAQAEAGSLTLQMQPSSVGDLLAEAVEAFRPRAEAKELSLDLQAPEVLPEVDLDRTRISQVVGNLLENAIFNTPSGGTVTIRAQLLEDEVRVTVSDTGPGIAHEDVPRIFDRFYRVDPSRARATGGAGLGLTIARELVEAHGGEIWVVNGSEGASGGGARFSFTLPLASNEPGQ